MPIRGVTVSTVGVLLIIMLNILLFGNVEIMQEIVLTSLWGISLLRRILEM